MSDDAGEYICNYMLYKNLQRSQTLANSKVESFFVHIPTFETIPQTNHESFAVALIN